MVEARQRSLRAFIFIAGDEEETIAYIQKHLVLLKDFLVVFTYPIGSKLLEFLQSQNLNFIEQKNSQKILSQLPESQKSIQKAKPTQLTQENLLTTQQTNPQQNSQPSLQENQKIQEKEKKQTKNPTLILHRTIRSGEEILAQGDVTIFGRVNNGACIQAQGNVQILARLAAMSFAMAPI